MIDCLIAALDQMEVSPDLLLALVFCLLIGFSGKFHSFHNQLW